MILEQTGISENIIIKTRAKRDLLILLIAAFVVTIIAADFDWLEKIIEFTQRYENLELDEIITAFIFCVFALVIFSFRRLKELKYLNADLQEKTTELKKAFLEIKQLKGILPICSGCKKIRDDKGYWNRIESYISTHTDAEFSHGLCPECLEKLYGKEDWYGKNI